jgi:hypothetical protein
MCRDSPVLPRKGCLFQLAETSNLSILLSLTISPLWIMKDTPCEHELPNSNMSPRQIAMEDSSSFAMKSTQRKNSRSGHAAHQYESTASQEFRDENTPQGDGARLFEPTRDRPMSSGSIYSEGNTNVPPKSLTTFDLGALVFNKMVGTGIFTVPGHVLEATGSKTISICFWVAGGVYTAMW